MIERPKFDEFLVKDNEARALISYVSKYYRSKSKIKKAIPQAEADKQIKKVLNIIKGEYVPANNRLKNFSKRSLSV